MVVWDQSVYSRKRDPHRFSTFEIKGRIFLSFQPTSLNHLIQQMDDLPFYVPPITLAPEGALIIRWYRNINLFSIAYAFRPRLRDRLTLSRLALLRKPWAFGERVFHPLYRYSCQHGLFCSVQSSSRSTFIPNRMLPYRCLKRDIPQLR